MKEIHVLAFVQTERKDGVTVYHRRSNKVAFTDIVKALDAAENQCFAMFDQYRNHGYNVKFDDYQMTLFHYSDEHGLAGTWNFYVDSMPIID